MASDRDIYKDCIDFKALAKEDTDFAKFLKSNGQLDFSDPEAVQQLSKSLLKRDFKLNLVLPPDRLCPPIPNRLSYIHWMQDLLDTTSSSGTDVYDPERKVTGLDIGTGASCIYPLLGCASRPNWIFIGTDIDDHSFSYAEQNVQLNKLEGHIHLQKTDPAGPLIPLDIPNVKRYLLPSSAHANAEKQASLDFTLSNPPFYTSATDLHTSATLKSRPPLTACTGSPSEMVTAGGEIAFVQRMIRDSQQLRTRVQWYSSMLGKLSSVPVIVDTLKTAGVTNWAVTEFVMSGRTRRWAVAWSFGPWRPRVDVARGCAAVGREYLPFPSEFVVVVAGQDVAEIHIKLQSIFVDLGLVLEWDAASISAIGFVHKNVWSRAARREAVKKGKIDEGIGEPVMGFKITTRNARDSKEVIEVVIRWLMGDDSVLFESFCGMLKRKLDV